MYTEGLSGISTCFPARHLLRLHMYGVQRMPSVACGCKVNLFLARRHLQHGRSRQYHPFDRQSSRPNQLVWVSPLNSWRRRFAFLVATAAAPTRAPKAEEGKQAMKAAMAKAKAGQVAEGGLSHLLACIFTCDSVCLMPFPISALLPQQVQSWQSIWIFLLRRGQ